MLGWVDVFGCAMHDVLMYVHASLSVLARSGPSVIVIIAGSGKTTHGTKSYTRNCDRHHLIVLIPCVFVVQQTSITLRNIGGQTANISGWRLTDSDTRTVDAAMVSAPC